MANEWKCSRCSSENDVSSVTCVTCGLMRGSAVLPTGSVPPRANDPTPVPPGDQLTGIGTDPGVGAARSDGPPPSAPGWAALRGEPAAPPTEPTADTAAPPSWIGPDGAPVERAPMVDAASADAEAPVPFWRRIPVGGLLFLVLVVGGGLASWYFSADRSDTGEITGAGDLQAGDLRVGDCFDLKGPESEEVGDVKAVPCIQEHEYELFFVGSLAGGDYPAEAVFEQYVETNCLPSFDAYIGKAYDDSELDLYWLYPTDDAWRQGDRSVQCAVYHPRISRLTESLKASNR